MNISDLAEEEIVPGIRVKAINTGKLGTITYVDHKDDDYTYILWDKDERPYPYAGFYRHLSTPYCEVLLNKDGSIKKSKLIINKQNQKHNIPLCWLLCFYMKKGYIYTS